MKLNSFVSRHVGPREHDVKLMLEKIGVSSIEELINQTIPSNIRLKKDLNLDEGISEYEYLNLITKKASKNKVFKSYIGQGYYGTITPSVIKRNILENPGWYTAYTPYQAEISQGRLEGLLNYQTMVSDLTGFPVANASLLDEGTAAAEAMIMFFNTRKRDAVKEGINKFFVDENCFNQTIDVLKTRATPLGIELVIGNVLQQENFEGYFGLMVQTPNKYGEINDYKEIASKSHQYGCRIVAAADILSLALITPPAEWGADVAIGSTQRFGIPMGYGGPHAAYFATTEDYKRNMPGRIIGVSLDRLGNPALRMALQTREQHIRRDKATSNICTAQALLAIMAGMYAVYHGPKGIQKIANDIAIKTAFIANQLSKKGINLLNKNLFDTISFTYDNIESLKNKALNAEINFNYFDNNIVSISIDETTTKSDIEKLLSIFDINEDIDNNTKISISETLKRTSTYLQHKVFNAHHSETEMMRYLKKLENKDISLTHSMISLGSCTMKLNAATQLYPISMPEFANIHPFAPKNQVEGYTEIILELEKWLCEITGFEAISFQPNSGAQGEYTGLLTIRAYHHNNGNQNRNIALIPSSAHGTNPASAVMAGMKVIVVKCDDKGNIDVEDLKAKAEQYKDDLSCLMVTYPSTHGVFEKSIVEITDTIHNYGGLVYMDGANMNAQVGLTNPGKIGADVCHLNLHKTFAIPHGGGGPGVGPIGVNSKLKPFLPKHTYTQTGGEKGTTAVSSAPYGSALILLISYAYVKMLGAEGLKYATEMAIVNANYLKALLEEKYSVLYTGNAGRVAHEMIIDCREYKKTVGIEVEDIAKRLIDYGFHAPTVSFPVAGTLMIEPTESESKQELDLFAEALNKIRDEISEIEKGVQDKSNNVLKNAPHTALEVIDSNWDKNYTRERAAYPINHIKNNKYWVPVARVDNAYGDRNLICSCPSVSEYEEAFA